MKVLSVEFRKGSGRRTRQVSSMALRVTQLQDESTVAAAASALAVRRAALWGLLVSKLIGGWGVQWDIQWHVIIGRDSFWIPPHVMTYAGVGGAALLSFGVLAWETLRPGPGDAAGPRVTGLPLGGTLGYHLAASGIAITVLAAPVDDLWHRLFGLDVTLWSPPHLMGLFGSVVNTLACLVIARECYPASSRLRLAAMLVAGAMLYGGLQLAVDPSGRIAYVHGGIRFYTFAILAALLIPTAFVLTARLSGRRWAPLAAVVIVVGLGMIGHQIARVGFDTLQPVSVIEAEILKDPTSPIAVANEMARKDGRVPGRTGGGLYLWGLIPVLVMVVVDARRRPMGATLAWAVTLFLVTGKLMALRPSLAPRVPDIGTTLIALALTILAAIVGGWVARALSDRLEGLEPDAQQA